MPAGKSSHRPGPRENKAREDIDQQGPLPHWHTALRRFTFGMWPLGEAGRVNDLPSRSAAPRAARLPFSDEDVVDGESLPTLQANPSGRGPGARFVGNRSQLDIGMVLAGTVEKEDLLVRRNIVKSYGVAHEADATAHAPGRRSPGPDGARRDPFPAGSRATDPESPIRPRRVVGPCLTQYAEW